MINPRQYLSFSSMDLFERNQERWAEVYLFGSKIPINRGMAFGRQMADSLEKDELSGDITLDLIMEKLPKFEIMDKVIERPKGDIVEVYNPTKGKIEQYKVPVLIAGGERIPLVAKPDTIKKDMTAFKEYKTGQGMWNKGKVDKLNQITFYATAIFITTGKIPNDIELVHVLTEKTTKDSIDAKLTATGDIYRYPTSRHMTEVLNMMVRMKKNWVEMKKVAEKTLI